MIFFKIISLFTLEIQWYHSQPPIYPRTAVAESLLLIVLLTPSKALLRLSKERMKSAMPLFTLQGLNKSISVKICQKDPFSIIWFSLAADKLITLVALMANAMSKLKNNPFANIMNIFCLKKTRKLPRAFMM